MFAMGWTASGRNSAVSFGNAGRSIHIPQEPRFLQRNFGFLFLETGAQDCLSRRKLRNKFASKLKSRKLDVRLMSSISETFITSENQTNQQDGRKERRP